MCFLLLLQADSEEMDRISAHTTFLMMRIKSCSTLPLRFSIPTTLQHSCYTLTINGPSQEVRVGVENAFGRVQKW